MNNLNGKQNLRPEKGIYSYLLKFYHAINTVYMECTAFLKNYFVYLSCAFMLPLQWHFQISHTWIPPFDNLVWPQCMTGSHILLWTLLVAKIVGKCTHNQLCRCSYKFVFSAQCAGHRATLFSIKFSIT